MQSEEPTRCDKCNSTKVNKVDKLKDIEVFQTIFECKCCDNWFSNDPFRMFAEFMKRRQDK